MLTSRHILLVKLLVLVVVGHVEGLNITHSVFFLLTPHTVEAVLGAENGLLPRGQVMCANFLSGNMLEIEPASTERPDMLLHRRQ